MISEQVFKALCDTIRLRMLSLLMQRELCVCEIIDCLDLSQSNASRHLTILKNAGVLSGWKQAQWIYYKIDVSFPAELHGYLSLVFTEHCVYAEDQDRLKNCRAAEICRCKITEGRL